MSIISKIKVFFRDLKRLFKEDGNYFELEYPIVDYVKSFIDLWVLLFQVALFLFIVGLPAWIAIAIWQLWLR